MGILHSIPVQDDISQRISNIRAADPFLIAKELSPEDDKTKWPRKKVFGNDRNPSLKLPIPQHGSKYEDSRFHLANEIYPTQVELTKSKVIETRAKY